MPSSVHTERRTTRLGIDGLLEKDRKLIAGQRIGLVCNPASIDSLRARRRPPRRRRLELTALFGPQHGFRSDLQDNMIESPHAQDAKRRVPVLLALQRDARADRGDARRHRRAGDRSAGRRHADLHLHLHDGQLPARRAHGTASASSSATARIRSTATTSRGRRSSRSTRRSSGSSRSRCGTA